MNLTTGLRPPLHKRFNEKKALVYIRNRYKNFKEKIAKQIEALQQDSNFRIKCQEYYKKGYKDWVICGAIFNCMLNWKAKEKGLDFSPEATKQFLELQNLLNNFVYPTEKFLGEEIDRHIKSHSLYALNSYGFEMRRHDFKIDVVEKFLRERMRHFDFDLPHDPLFSDPPGNWPKI